MTEAEDDFEIIRGSGNVFRDLGDPDPDVQHIKAILAAEVLRAQQQHGLSNPDAARRARVKTDDITRVRRCELDEYSIDQLFRIANALDPQVQLVVARTPLPDETRAE